MAQDVPAEERRAVAVVDVDGVVADVRHRLRFLRARDWDAFFAAAEGDPPLGEGIAMVRELARNHDVIWLTGRPERFRQATLRWLRAQHLPLGELRMRPDHDRRPARVFKRAQVRRLGRSRTVAVVVDDDPQVVALLKADGWPVHLADWVAYEQVLGDAQEDSGRT